jgi:hypothetical protein
MKTYEARRILVADNCLVGVITGPRPGGPADGRGGLDGGGGLGLKPARGDCFVWARFGGWSEVSDDGPEVDRRSSEGSWIGLELEGRERSRGRCDPVALAASAITVFISTLGDN